MHTPDTIYTNDDNGLYTVGESTIITVMFYDERILRMSIAKAEDIAKQIIVQTETARRGKW